MDQRIDMTRRVSATETSFFVPQVPAEFAPYVQFFRTSGTFSTDYFGHHVEAYNFVGSSGVPEPWPADFGIPISIVRDLGVFSPGDGSINFPVWGVIQPTSSGPFSWTVMDTWMNVNSTKGVDVIFPLHSPPSWTGGGGTNPSTNEVATFFSALATRYAGRIQYYEGYNEFNASSAIYSGNTAQMVQIQRAMYEAVKAADPSCTVLSYTITGLYFGTNNAWDTVSNAGGSSWFDIAAFHSYGNDTGEAVVVTAGKFMAALAADGLSSKPVIDTEGSWQPDTLTDSTKQTAVVMKQHILEFWMGVTRKMWYALDGADVGHLTNPQFTSTLTQAGTGYITTAGWINGASISGAFSINGIVWYGDLTRAGGYQARVIWVSAGTQVYAVPPAFTQYKDYTGANTIVSGGTVILGLLPILLENHDP